MTRLEKLGFIARQSELAFDLACQEYYPDYRWGYYRAKENGHDIPDHLHKKCDEYIHACRAYYLERDKRNGVLGSSGA
jgi:hypothetical protein